MCLVDGDNVLPVDLVNVVNVDTFVRTVRHRDDALLEELFLRPDELVAGGPDGHHAVEVVVPLVADRPVTPPPVVGPAPVRRLFPPSSASLRRRRASQGRRRPYPKRAPRAARSC